MNLTPAALIAAETIGVYDPALAARFLSSRFQRVTLAKAFAASVRNEDGDHALCLAEMDAGMRLDPLAWEECQ